MLLALTSIQQRQSSLPLLLLLALLSGRHCCGSAARATPCAGPSSRCRIRNTTTLIWLACFFRGADIVLDALFEEMVAHQAAAFFQQQQQQQQQQHAPGLGQSALRQQQPAAQQQQPAVLQQAATQQEQQQQLEMATELQSEGHVAQQPNEQQGASSL